MSKLIDADEVLAMFCGDCMCRGESLTSLACRTCDTRARINLAEDRTQQA